MIDTKAIEAVFDNSLKLKKEEKCLVVTDRVKESIGQAFYDYLVRKRGNADIVVMDPTQEHGAEPPENVAAAMLSYDVELLITHKSLTHTKARAEATARGVRIATMPSITEDIVNRCLDVDYNELRKRSQKLHGLLKKAERVRVVTKLGTDMRFEIGNSGFFGENGGVFDYPGAFGNLPEGEIAFAPETCEGKYLIDASFPDVGLLEKPITFDVCAGFVETISGEHADQIIRRLDRVGKNAYKVAELGIGLNPKAKITGNILEDEKVVGTAHIAVGNNTSFGGDNNVPLHLDGVILRPDIYVDDMKLMEEGRFVGY